MLSSMTGYANAECRAEGWSLFWEFRSVNHRYLDCNLRLPESFRFLENDVRQLVTSKLRRGKVDAVLTAKRDSSLAASLDLNIANRIADGLRQIADLMPELVPGTAMDVLQWPGVFQEPEINRDRLSKAVLDTAAGAVEALGAARKKEGSLLGTIMLERLARLSPLSEAARARRPAALETTRTKIIARLTELALPTQSERLEQEMVYLAQRMDVAEELDRLDAHIGEAKALIENGGTVGRKLDFLMQELHREANTLGAKAGDLAITQASVEMKVLIEQLREQVQNIE